MDSRYLLATRWLCAHGSRTNCHLRSIPQPIETVRRNNCVRFQSLHFGHIAVGCYDGDCLCRDSLIRLDQIHERAIVISLDRVVRQERHAFVRIDQQVRVDELIREKRIIVIVKCRS